MFLSLDSARHLLKYSLLTKPLTILAVVIGGLFSLEGVALGYSLCLVASWFIGLAWLRGVTDMPTAEIFKDGIALLTAALVAGTTTGILGGLVSGTNLALLWAVGAGAFMGMLLVLPRTRTSVRQSGGYLAAVLRHRGRGTEGSRHDHVVGQHQEES